MCPTVDGLFLDSVKESGGSVAISALRKVTSALSIILRSSLLLLYTALLNLSWLVHKILSLINNSNRHKLINVVSFRIS